MPVGSQVVRPGKWLSLLLGPGWTLGRGRWDVVSQSLQARPSRLGGGPRELGP